MGDLCQGLEGEKPVEEETPAVTLDDVARFRPGTAVHRMEPQGWTVVGLPTNFYAAIDQHVREGSLLGRPASVRFTPVAFEWEYGDGDLALLTTKGAAWSDLGGGEFAATPTSHVYERAGTYVARLTIHFAAEYRFAGGQFVPIAGTLAIPANELTLTVGSATTVLVEDDCTANPRGPGC